MSSALRITYQGVAYPTFEKPVPLSQIMGARSDIFVCTTARSYPQITHTAQYCLGLLTGNRPGLLYAIVMLCINAGTGPSSLAIVLAYRKTL